MPRPPQKIDPVPGMVPDHFLQTLVANAPATGTLNGVTLTANHGDTVARLHYEYSSKLDALANEKLKGETS